MEADPDESGPQAARAAHPLLAGATQSSGDPDIVDPAEHTIVFTNLVTDDKDIVGLVAYSIYKQNKYDWLTAFGRQVGRMPDEAEAQAYLLGESTPRRLATYRHLAEATLEGRGVEVSGGRSPATGRSFGFGASADGPSDSAGLWSSRTLLMGAIVAILVVIGLVWAYHSGGPPKS